MIESLLPFAGVRPFASRYAPNSRMISRELYGSRRQRVDDLLRRVVADAQLLLVDERVVDAVDHQLAQIAVAIAVLVLIARDVVAEAQRLKEVLVHDVRAGRDNRVHHVVADHVDKDLLQAGRDQRSGQAQDHPAIGVAQHHLVDRGSPRRIARGVGHRGHRVHQRNHVVGGKIDVLDGRCEQFFFGWHSQLLGYRVSPTVTLLLL